MTEIVDQNQIEAIVGVRRDKWDHYAKLTVGGTIYILHSGDCIAEGKDLRECSFSKALNQKQIFGLIKNVPSEIRGIWLKDTFIAVSKDVWMNYYYPDGFE